MTNWGPRARRGRASDRSLGNGKPFQTSEEKKSEGGRAGGGCPKERVRGKFPDGAAPTADAKNLPLQEGDLPRIRGEQIWGRGTGKNKSQPYHSMSVWIGKKTREGAGGEGQGKKETSL